MWPDRRLIELFGIQHPIVLAPMAGAMDGTLVAEVSDAGGLGSLPCAMLAPDAVLAEVARIRIRTAKPFALNFFCHVPPVPDNAREAAWRDRLAPYYRELGLNPADPVPSSQRLPFDAAFADVVEEVKPRVVSFHFGLPARELVDRVKAAGSVVASSATTVEEARWLENRGVDVIIAQGAEAGGHRGTFLTEDIAGQAGTFALLPQIADAVDVPVIAAGGIADGRGVAAAFVLGAAAAQIGTAYLLCHESKISEPYRAALKAARDDGTALTNLMTGRPARGLVNRVMREIGPMAPIAPAFPLAGGALAPLRAAAEKLGSGDFSPLWSGQAASLGRKRPAGDFTRALARDAQEIFRKLG